MIYLDGDRLTLVRLRALSATANAPSSELTTRVDHDSIAS